MTQDGQDVISRLGKLKPAQRRNGQALHRPLLALWAIAQAVHGQPRQQPWTVIRKSMAPLLESFAGASDGEQAAVTPFWVLRRTGMWEVAQSEDLVLTSDGRRPTLGTLDAVNPLAGLPEHDYERLASNPELAAWAAGTLLLRFFTPTPDGLLEALGLTELMASVDTSLRPRVGEPFPHRNAVADVYGGNRVLGITPLGDGILTVYSDDKGPYADGRIPGTNWIAYVGDGLNGDQKLTAGNANMATYQAGQRALRYWHRPYGSVFTFETWTVIVQRRRRWGHGNDGQPRREFVWVLAPVPSPLRDTWPQEVLEALGEDHGELHDDTADIIPLDIPPQPDAEPLSDRDRYQRLAAAAHRTSNGRTRRSTLATVERYLRSPAARTAVLLRSGGHCENPTCLGHPLERTDAGAPLLEVDHVNDLGRGGQDTPESMIALCPNCHALKTRGANRADLRRTLLAVARERHRDFGRA